MGPISKCARRWARKTFFSSGSRPKKLQNLQSRHAYDPSDIVRRSPAVGRVIESLQSQRFCALEPGLFHDIVGYVMDRNDPFLHLADFESYSRAHDHAAALYARPDSWTAKSILNVARMGYFSSDRTVREYAEDIWKVTRKD